jgi:uncharacterized protein YbjQ (UPF0145 family)
MAFWKRTSPEEQQRKLQEQQEAEASQRSLEGGGLPNRAKQRLSEEMEAGHPLFSSDLSANEFLLTRNLGYVPLSQVMGSSIYQVGWQYTRRYSYGPVESELTNVTNAHQEAAQLALSRLRQEASLLKAHGVIGVRFAQRDYEWGQNLLEYTAIGTAIKLPNTPPPEKPFLSDLSGQEFWTLLQAGYFPAGIVYGYCAYNISLGSALTWNLKSWYGGRNFNQEITPFSHGVNTARHLAMKRVTNLARSYNAVGIVGMHITNSRQVIDYEMESQFSGKQYYLDLYIQFSAVGTAIREQKKDHVIPPPKPTLTLTDVRPERWGETRELTFRD